MHIYIYLYLYIYIFIVKHVPRSERFYDVKSLRRSSARNTREIATSRWLTCRSVATRDDFIYYSELQSVIIIVKIIVIKLDIASELRSSVRRSRPCVGVAVEISIYLYISIYPYITRLFTMYCWLVGARYRRINKSVTVQ